MTVSLKHTFQSVKTDSVDPTLVQPSNWNQEHILTAAAGKVLGRDTSGAGEVQELPIAVTATGDVGIGTSSPLTKLHILDTASVFMQLTASDSGASRVGQNGTALTFGNDGADGSTERMRINAAGNVGIGTSSPTSKLTATGIIESTTGGFKFPDGTTQATAFAGSAVSYPQNIQSANYTLVLSDAGKQIFHPASDNNIRTYTIPANASVAYPIGTVILFTVENAGQRISVAINSDILVLGGGGMTGTAPVFQNNTLMAMKVTATKWMANYLDQTSATSLYSIAFGASSSPFVLAYTWSGSGFGTKYANPATLPTGSGSGIAFSPASDAIAMAHGTSPFVSAYPWSGSGFGTKYANPATLPNGNGQGIAFSPASDAIAVAHNNPPTVSAYPWSGSGFGTRYSDPATPPTGEGYGVAFSPAGNAIAVAHTSSPFVSAYPWSGSGFGTKYANPATLPTGSGNGIAFSPASDAIAMAHGTSPFVSAYPWSGSGFGTKYADPATLPTGAGSSVAFSPAGDAIAVAHTTSPFVSAYPWSGSGFGTKYTNPATLPTGNGIGVAFSPAGDAIAVAHTSSPFVSAYPWSGSGFGTKYANPVTLPVGSGRGVAFTTNL